MTRIQSHGLLPFASRSAAHLVLDDAREALNLNCDSFRFETRPAGPQQLVHATAKLDVEDVGTYCLCALHLAQVAVKVGVVAWVKGQVCLEFLGLVE